MSDWLLHPRLLEGARPADASGAPYMIGGHEADIMTDLRGAVTEWENEMLASRETPDERPDVSLVIRAENAGWNLRQLCTDLGMQAFEGAGVQLVLAGTGSRDENTRRIVEEFGQAHDYKFAEIGVGQCRVGSEAWVREVCQTVDSPYVMMLDGAMLPSTRWMYAAVVRAHRAGGPRVAFGPLLPGGRVKSSLRRLPGQLRQFEQVHKVRKGLGGPASLVMGKEVLEQLGSRASGSRNPRAVYHELFVRAQKQDIIGLREPLLAMQAPVPGQDLTPMRSGRPSPPTSITMQWMGAKRVPDRLP